MTARQVLIQHIAERMCHAFVSGDLAYAKDLELFLGTLERMTDEQYLINLDGAENLGAIS